MPRRGELSVFFSGWYLWPIEQRFTGKWNDAKLDQCLRTIRELERMLINDGAVIVKCWYHMAEKDQRRKLKSLARSDRDLGGVRVGQYSFDDETLAWILSLDEKALDSDALAFIDEIGRLELDHGVGLAPLIPLLAQPRRADTVVVVRGDLLDAMVARVVPAAPYVVTLDPTRRDAAWAELETLLFRP